MTPVEKVAYFNQLLNNQEHNFVLYLNSICLNVDKSMDKLISCEQILNYFLQLKTQYYLNSVISYDQFMVNVDIESQEFKQFCFNSKAFIQQKLDNSYPIILLIQELKQAYIKTLYF